MKLPLRLPLGAVLVCLALLLTACDSTGEDPPPPAAPACGYLEGEPRSQPGDPSVLMPLAVGNCWAYLAQSEGYADTISTRITLSAELTVDGQRLQSFGGYTKAEVTPIPPDRRLTGTGDGGLYFRGGVAPDDTLAANWLEYKYPGQIGDSWPIPADGYIPPHPGTQGYFVVVDTLVRTLVAVDEPINTPAGTFRCYVYKHTEGLNDDVAINWNVYQYLAPGVGLVAEIRKDQYPGHPEDSEPSSRRLLVEYRLR